MTSAYSWPILTLPQVKKISDSVYEFCKPDNPSVEIIFFHGIQMGEEDVSELHLSTWTVKSEEADAPPEYWPQTFFAKDEHLTSKNISVRALTARYDPSKYKTHNTGRLDLYNIAENFTHSIIDNNRVNVGLREGVPVIMVGHSFGGLVMKKLVDQVAEKARLNGNHSKNLQKFLDNLKGLFYYSTPHLALKDEVFQRLFPPGKSYSDLPKLLEELNKGAGRLHAVLTTYAKGHKIMVNEAFDVNNTDLVVLWNLSIQSQILSIR